MLLKASRIWWYMVVVSWLVSMPSLQAAQLFRTPVAATPLPQELAWDCFRLEQEIAALIPLTYSYKPSFYDNPYQGGAILLGTTVSPLAFAYPVYDYYLDYREASRVIPAQDRIQQLQRLKADRHCFES
ncbi:MAG: hypothetical protein KDI63_06815 [Gammaproteobacteria bacterium]|nr:hypothetical protein [Gammaproteobacteria bacterium]